MPTRFSRSTRLSSQYTWRLIETVSTGTLKTKQARGEGPIKLKDHHALAHRLWGTLNTSLYRTTMASDLAVSADELPSTDELMACWRRCTDLRQAVKERQAGGTALARAVVAASFVSSFDVQAAAVPSLGLGQCRHWRSSNLW